MGFAELVAAADRAAIKLLGGVSITYTPGPSGLPLQLPSPLGLQPEIVTGIFDTAFVLAKGDVPAGVEAAQPAVFFRRSDLPTDPLLDDPILTIAGVTYRVIERDPDDMGGIVLFIRRNT